VTKILGDQIKEDEIGGAWSKHGKYEKCIQNFDRKSEGKSPVGRHWRI